MLSLNRAIWGGDHKLIHLVDRCLGPSNTLRHGNQLVAVTCPHASTYCPYVLHFATWMIVNTNIKILVYQCKRHLVASPIYGHACWIINAFGSVVIFFVNISETLSQFDILNHNSLGKSCYMQLVLRLHPLNKFGMSILLDFILMVCWCI